MVADIKYSVWISEMLIFKFNLYLSKWCLYLNNKNNLHKVCS